jgi:hypothetical protein
MPPSDNRNSAKHKYKIRKKKEKRKKKSGKTELPEKHTR